ncbi:MAG: hypothetical protein JXB36_12225 [Gammaproteobacteria bacterium]|nr:hypothetical protein [Gammaproteobacteria bacterium]
MPQESRAVGAAAEGSDRFDGEAVRRILERAAREQHRLNEALADSYSLDELEEMAAEARISPEALRNAIEAETDAIEAQSALEGWGARAAGTGGGRARAWLAAVERRLPGRTPAARRLMLTCTGGVAAAGLLFAFPVIAETLLWAVLLALILFSVLVLLGLSPF